MCSVLYFVFFVICAACCATLYYALLYALCSAMGCMLVLVCCVLSFVFGV